MNVLRAVSTEGFGRHRYYREIRRRLDADPQFRPYFEQESTELPRFYVDLVRKDLGPLWKWLPSMSKPLSRQSGNLENRLNRILFSEHEADAAVSFDIGELTVEASAVTGAELSV